MLYQLSYVGEARILAGFGFLLGLWQAWSTTSDPVSIAFLSLAAGSVPYVGIELLRVNFGVGRRRPLRGASFGRDRETAAEYTWPRSALRVFSSLAN